MENIENNEIKEENTPVEKTCDCDENCTCGCNEGLECTCGGECHQEEECSCDESCTCGCQDGEECTCENNEEKEETSKETETEEVEEVKEEAQEKPKKKAKKVKKEEVEEEEVEGKGKVIVITSGKGGVGKTTTSANIGTALAKAGNKVAVIDTDIGLRNLDLLLGLENRIVYTIVDVVEKRCKLKQALVKDKKNPSLCLLAAAQTRDKSALSSDQLKDICKELKKDFDYILIDCPAGIEQGFQNAVAGASEAIVVTTPEMSAVRDADRIIGLINSKEGIDKYRVLVNRVRPKMIKNNEMMSVDDVLSVLSAELMGVIPEDTGIITSTNKGEPIVNDEKSLAGQAYTNVAKRLMGEDVPLLDLDQPKGLMGKIKKLFSKKA